MTDGVEQWILELPVWFQTPLVLAVLLVVSAGVAVVMFAVARVLPPMTREEIRAFRPEDAPEDTPDLDENRATVEHEGDDR